MAEMAPAPRWWRLRVRVAVWLGRLLGREVGVCEACPVHPWTVRLL